MFKLKGLCLPAVLNLLLSVIITVLYVSTDSLPPTLLITGWIFTILMVYTQYKLCNYGENFLSWMILVVPNILSVVLLFTPVPNGAPL